ncbi:hypothetical protein [Brevibacillus sp. SYSU BS000544]|uniref:hypothetical protein n=1 Tax=Brevibacillus sp. SYSU BS000544 TaxID=3416443 RepID=UPI003CE57AA9
MEDKCTHDLWKQLHKLIGKEIAVLTTADNEVSGKLVEVTHGSISIFEPHHGALIIPLCNIVLYTHEESDRRQVKP